MLRLGFRNSRPRTMRVGINCISLDPNYAGGINSFTLGLLAGFESLSGGDSFVIFANSANVHLFERWQNVPNFRLVVMDATSIRARKVLRRASVFLASPALYRAVSDFLFADLIRAMDSECDVLYTPTTVLLSYNSKVPNVLSMHDVQQCHYPQFFTWNELSVRRITYPLSARYATHMQASSDFLKRDLVENLPGLDARNVTVIPEGVDIELFARPADPSCLEKYSLPRRYLFFPAQLWPHKNHITVLRALAGLKEKHGLKVPLVLTGADYSAGPLIREFIRRNGLEFVHYLGKVPFQELLALYQQAAFMITAVLYESSSLPVLESAAAGTPIIASSTPPNQELGRRLKINLFPADEADALEALLLGLWNDSAKAAEDALFNSREVEYYSWQNAAKRYMELFHRMVA